MSHSDQSSYADTNMSSGCVNLKDAEVRAGLFDWSVGVRDEVHSATYQVSKGTVKTIVEKWKRIITATSRNATYAIM